MKGCLLLILVIASACVHQVPEALTPACYPDNVVSWEISVAPIIHSKCSIPGCHNGSNPYIGELNTFPEVQGNASDIVYQLANRSMPPSNMPQLTPVEKAEIECWINQGAKAP